MTITRNGAQFVLTDEELEQAFREWERLYRKENAARHLFEYCGIIRDDDPYWDTASDSASAIHKERSERNRVEFQEKYGIPFDDLLDEKSKYYILDILVNKFEDCQDCDVSENDNWYGVINDTLSDLEVGI